jgi:hypothetical protein
VSSFREERRKFRRSLHQYMADTVLFIPETGATPVPVKVRIQDVYREEGAVGGISKGWAERKEIVPIIRFVDFQPRKGALVVTEDMGIYNIERTYPAHDISIDAEVTKLSPGQATTEGLDVTLPWGGLQAPVLP